MDHKIYRKFEAWICRHPLLIDAENRALTIALIISLSLHVILVIMMSYRNITYSRKIKKNIEVLYQIEARKEKIPAPARDYKTITEQRLLPKPKSANDMASPFAPNLSKASPKLDAPKGAGSRQDLPQKPSMKMPALEGKRHVSVPMLDSEKISNPKYVGYHDRIRTKIRNRAYLYVDNPAFEKGDVYMTFVVASNGEVTAIKLIEEKTHANDYLRGVGVRSIKESSPFPPFPADLKYPELTFNVIISFETGE